MTVTVSAEVTVTVAGPHVSTSLTTADGDPVSTCTTGGDSTGLSLTRLLRVVTLSSGDDSAVFSLGPEVTLTGNGTMVTADGRTGAVPVPVAPAAVVLKWPYGAVRLPVAAANEVAPLG